MNSEHFGKACIKNENFQSHSAQIHVKKEHKVLIPKLQKSSEGKCRGLWSENAMKLAVESVLENKMSARVASNQYHVPKSTLHRRVREFSNNNLTSMKPAMGSFKSTFDDRYEAQLVEHMKNLESRSTPLTKTEFQKLAFDLAETLNLPHRFNKETKMAGKDFYAAFRKRHPELIFSRVTIPKVRQTPSDFKGRGLWSEDAMKLAVTSVLEHKMSTRSASDHYRVPRSTLHRRIKEFSNNQLASMKPQMGFFKTTFEAKYEDQLVEHMKDLESRSMPLSKKEFLKLAYDIAESLNLPHRFNKETKMAGKDFYASFMCRHPELSYRKTKLSS